MTSSTTPKTVLLKGNPIVNEAAAATSSNIKPGMLLERTSAGQFRPHSTVGGRAAKVFAAEAGYVGGTIDDTYEDSDQVPAYSCEQGAQIYAFLSAGEDVALGAYLQSDGAGALEATDSDGHAVAVALEAVDNGGGASAVRIKVEVL